MRIRRTIHYMLGLGICSLFFSFSFAQNTQGPLGLYSCTDVYNETIAKSLVTKDPSNVKGIIENFCKTVTPLQGCAEDETKIYIPGHSIFLASLCEQVGTPQAFFNPAITAGEDTYLLNSRFLKKWKATKHCMKNDTFADCDLQDFLSSFFDTLMDDYLSIRQALIYGAKDTEMDIQQQVNIFSQNYYMLNICDNVTNTYPKACKELTKYIKKAQSLFNDLTLINLPALLKNPNSASCDLTNAATKFTTYDMIYCGLYGENSTSMNAFINLIYNELFWYRLFMAYYSPLVLSDPDTFYKDVKKETIIENIDNITTTVQRSQMALELSLKILRERRNTFPLHIGFLMYQEDVSRFMKAMAKIYTPFVTLYDKFTNVQKKE